MNAALLKSEIIMKGLKMGEFFTELNKDKSIMTPSSFYKKMRGESEFTREEIKAIAETLDLSDRCILDIFFSEQVS